MAWWIPVMMAAASVASSLIGRGNKPEYAQAPPDWRLKYGEENFWPWAQEYFKNQGALNAPYQNFRFAGPEGSDPITIQRMDPRTRDYLGLAASFFANAPGQQATPYQQQSTAGNVLQGIGAGLASLPSNTSGTGSASSVFEQPGSNAGADLIAQSTRVPSSATESPILQPPAAPQAPSYPPVMMNGRTALPPVVLRR